MQDTASVDCPFCGQSMELVLDTSIASQCFVTDCEVCCRPFDVTAECEAGEILSVTAAGN
ncbi:MAG: CPXCG motif-containing cysteine-rich protein [Limisphaerales bacterium]